MTLIIGIRCTNGIVMAADGAATLGSLGTPTAQQKTVKKLRILQNKIIVGSSGHVGLGQRLEAVIDDGFGENKFGGRAEKAIGVMRELLWKIAGPEWDAAASAGRVVGQQVASMSAIATMMVALPLNKRAELVQFDQQCAPELASDSLPFVALGSGQLIADPYLAFVRRVLWPATGCPTIQDGIFTAVWTLVHAVETNTGGVAEPIQVVTLEQGAKDWAARELTDDELQEHRSAVKDAERAVKEWRSTFTSTPITPAPPAPPA